MASLRGGGDHVPPMLPGSGPEDECNALVLFEFRLNLTQYIIKYYSGV